MNETELDTYVKTKSNWGFYPWKNKLDPYKSTTGGFITGHKYRIHWGETGIDFYSSMKVYISEEWEATDESLFLVHNFTDVRAKIEVKLNGIVF